MDADLVEGTITMAMQLQRVAGELRHDETKTDDSTRAVALPQPCVRALGRHRVQQTADRLAAGDRWTESDLVFTTRKDTPIEPRNINRTFDALVKRAGVQRTVFMISDTRAPRSSALALWLLPELDLNQQYVVAAQQSERARTIPSIWRSAIIPCPGCCQNLLSIRSAGYRSWRIAVSKI